jgi:phosphoglycerate dehydrogenase-like enzyme
VRADPNIVVVHWGGLDFFTPEHFELIESVGTVLDREAIGAWDDPRCDRLLPQADVLLGHWGCPSIDASVLDRAPNVGLFAYAAGTVKDTLAPEVFDRDLRVTSGALANAEPVAEFTLAAILLANKDVFWRRDRMRDESLSGRRQHPTVPIGNWDKTIGIIGASMVGRRTIDLLAAFPALQVVLFDPFVDEAEAERLGVTKVDLDELCAISDIVSIHAPDLPSTRGMVGREQLVAMRTGSTLINTARGRLVDHAALVDELASGRLSAMLDVTDPEPLPDGHPLLSLPNAYVTPHLAGSEGTELGRMTEYVVDEIRRWTAGEPARNEVTKASLGLIA